MGSEMCIRDSGIAALASTHALRELHCNLFEDVGLIALDDLDWYPLVGSGITALAQPTAEIGASAFECLLKRLRGARLGLGGG